MPWTVYNSDGKILQSAEVGNDSITNAKIADDAVDSDEIAAGAIDLAHMSVNSIDSDQYVDGSIDRVHLAADIIDGTKIDDDVINSEHYVAGSVDLEHMASQSVDEDNLYISNAGSNGEFLSKQSGNNGGLTWAAAGGIASVAADTTPQVGGSAGFDLQTQLLVGNGGTTGIAVSSTGAVNMAATPAVLAYNSATDTDISGNSAVHTLDMDAEVFDQGGDFASDVFTAPVTGRYFITASLRTEGVSTSNTSLQLEIISSNHSWAWIGFRRSTGAGFTNICLTGTNIIDMDAADTVYVTYVGAGEGSNVHDIIGATSHMTTWLSIVLVA